MNALLVAYSQAETPIEIAVVVLQVGKVPTQARWRGKTPVRVRLPWGVEVTVEAKDLGIDRGIGRSVTDENITVTDPFDPVAAKAALCPE